MKRRIGCAPVVMIMSLIVIFLCLHYYREENKTFRELPKQVFLKTKEGKTEMDFSRLPKDCVAWIRFKHPKQIDYPIMISKDNSYYLHRNMKKKYSFSGCIFEDHHNKKDFNDDNTIVYGHNMRNLTMFGNLKQYRSKSYWKKNKTFVIYTRTGYKRTYKIFSAVQVMPSSSIYTYRFADKKAYKEYLSYWKEASLYDTGVHPKTSDRIVTLSTCALQGSRRFAVQGVLVKDEKIPVKGGGVEAVETAGAGTETTDQDDRASSLMETVFTAVEKFEDFVTSLMYQH